MQEELKEYRVWSLDDVEMLHINDFARATGRSVQSTRHLIEDGNQVRRMKFFRDRSRLLIPITEIYGYPLTDPGFVQQPIKIYHYVYKDGEGFVRKFCEQCSLGTEPCEERKAADAVEVPKGDL